jgi:hypothetical protein
MIEVGAITELDGKLHWIQENDEHLRVDKRQLKIGCE